MTNLTRREFVAAGAAAGFRFRPDPLRVGLIGCGGRGTGAAENCTEAAKDVALVALADLFQDRLNGCRKYFEDRGTKIADDRCFTGFEAYKRLLATDVDLVILATPPGFRPIHFAAAIDAGKHVFMEKPVAVDPVGVRKVIEAGRKAKEKRLAVVAGTQRRHQRGYRETVKRLKDGAVGTILAARASWNQGGLWKHDRKSDYTDMEWQVRNWLYFDWLSGDHIVEQHIHNLDVVNWVMGAHPVRAVGVGGRQARTAPVYGNIYDHFAIDFEYPGGAHLLSMCRQQERTDGNVSEFILGAKGRSDPAGWIDGETKWRFEGEAPDAYVQEHADLIESIRRGEPLNESEQVAESTLTAIMGRVAAYSGNVVTWNDLMKSDLDLSPPTYEFGDLKIRPVPVPGK